jgi:hypothetical protein
VGCEGPHTSSTQPTLESEREHAHVLRVKPDSPVPWFPWQSPYVERLIGTLCRECLHHTVVLNDAHLRRPDEHRMVRQNRQLLTSYRQSVIPAYLLIDSVPGKRLEASEVSDAGERCRSRRVAWLG